LKSNDHFKLEDLIIYHRAIKFGEVVHFQILSFLKEEIQRLSSQLILASDAIALDITEGFTTTGIRFVQYLQITSDSIHECIVGVSKSGLKEFVNAKQNDELFQKTFNNKT